VPWIILDGPVDAIWIENLNTVLDDNKLLTLANGDRIQMSNTARLLFEVENLNNASPATVSRAGIVFIARECLGWKPLVSSWILQLRQHELRIQKQQRNEQRDQDSDQKHMELESMPDDAHDLLQDCLMKSFKQLEMFEDKSGVEYFLDSAFPSRVSQSLQLLRHLLDGARRDASFVGEAVKWAELIPVVVYFAVTWGVGGVYTEAFRIKVINFLQEQAIAPLLTRDDGRTFVASAYDGYFSHEGSYVTWSSVMPVWSLPASARPGLPLPFSQLVVPTSESIRIEYILKCLLLHGGSVMLVGDRGTAKTSNIEMFISEYGESETWTTRSIGFSSTSSVSSMQAALDGWVEKRQGRTFGPMGGKKMIVFVDDVSMPVINEWGDQPTNEFTRQLIEMSGCYNLERAGEWKTIVDLHWIAAMPRPSSSSNDLPPRLKRHFLVIGVPMPSQRVVLRVFGSIMDAWATLNKIPEQVQAVLSVLPAATYALLQSMLEKLLPTPAKFHYTFNIRDISRVFQGIMRINGDTHLKHAETAVSLWFNECRSVFSDRLCSNADVKVFEGAILAAAYGSIATLSSGSEIINKAVASMKQTFWVDFLSEINEEDENFAPPRFYEQCNDIERVRGRLFNLMKKHNEVPANRSVQLNLVLFDDAVQHIVRITRLLALERSNALLVGVGGSGKQSLARMAAFVARCTCCSIRAAPGYTVNSFLDDIRRLFKDTGVEGKATALLMTETDLKDDNFMDIMNSMLTTFSVPNLFTREDTEALQGEVRARASLDRVLIGETAHAAQAYFQQRVVQNFHVILTFSPVGNSFRSKSRSYPGLISGCNIDWFFAWPDEALASVSSKKLKIFCSEANVSLNESSQNALVKCFSSIHLLMIANAELFWSSTRRRVHFTPKTFLCMLDQFFSFYKKYLDINNSDSQKIRNGLQKLLNATEDVSVLRVSLKESEKMLGVARAKTTELLKSITAAAEIAASKTKECEAVAARIEKEADAVQADKDDTQKDLEAAQPALDAAIEALSSISTKDIQTLKKLGKPPELIKRIFDGVLILKQRPVVPWRMVVVGEKKVCENSYNTSLRMMDERDFVESLLNFEKDAINEETVELLMPYLEMPDFNFEAGKKASGNVAGLCSWIRAMCTYFDVSRFVKPKIEALAVAEIKLKVATSRLAKARAELKAQEAELASMHAKLDAAMEEKQKIEDTADQTRKKCDTADALIAGLSGERFRWTQQIAEFDAIIMRLAGDMCICSAAVSYFGPFNSEFRESLSSLVLKAVTDAKLPCTSGVSIVNTLCNDVMSSEWSLNGLPADALSVENGIIVTTSNRYPLLIDPQEQGKKWIQGQFMSSYGGPLVTCSIKDKRLMMLLEQCMTNGCSLLLEGVNEALEPSFDALLCKSFTRAGSMTSVLVGGKDCDIHLDFKLFMATKLSNPDFSPEFCANTAVVNFNVTLLGLENQLLSRIIGLERTELEDQRKALLTEVTNGSQKIKMLQDDLLNRLASTQGSLLADDSLVLVLTVTKDTVKDIQDKVAIISVTQAQISATREEYRPVAKRGAVMYGSLMDIGNLNPM
jgi:dynein heavy chain